MDATEILVDAFSRVTDVVHRAVDELPAPALVWRPEPDANPIGWLVWHLSRLQDKQVAELAGQPQVWLADQRWAPRFGLPDDSAETGQGHTSAQVAAIRPEDAAVLLEYHESVAATTGEFLAAVGAADLDRVVDTSYDPPVTMGVRLVSTVSDNIQHAGQARYLRGMYERTIGG